VSPVRYELGFYIPEDDIQSNVELVPKFHVALYASHAALAMVISKFSSNAAR
jgi:hypothetical protein